MVEWKTIGEICSNVFAGGTPSTKREDYYDGDIPWIRSGEIDFNVITKAERNITKDGYNNSSAKMIRKGSVVMAMTGATVAKSAVVEIETTANQSVCALETDEAIVNYKYLYYTLANNYFGIKSSAQGALTSLNLAMIKQIEVPVPSMVEQRRIVEILNTFTSCIDNLKQQIVQRRKQYEYYRDQLLDLEGKEGVVIVPLREIVKSYCTGATPNKGHLEYYESGTIPWLRTQDVKFNEIYEIYSFVTEEAVAKTGVKWIPSNCVIVAISGATAGRCAINKIPTTTNQHCLNLEINPKKALYKYVYYCVYNAYSDMVSRKQGARGDLNSSIILGITIPLPSLSEQQRILDILDKFETSIANLEAQLSQREKQYEYYRNKLLTFE